MFRRSLLLFACLPMLISGGRVFCQEEKFELTLGQIRQLEIRRLMNLYKKAPQDSLRNEGLNGLRGLGIQDDQIAGALNLDRVLEESRPAVRLIASKKLARSPNPARVVAIGNLRNLVAGESDPIVKWTHAVTLAAIAPDFGSALDILAAFPDDPILRDSLGLQEPTEADFLQATGGRLDEEPILTTSDYPPAEWLAARSASLPADNSASIGVRQPAPPPQKIPAHPLIAKRDFETILSLVEQDSEEAKELLRLYAEDFPHEMMAEKYVAPQPSVLSIVDWDWRDAVRILNLAGPDAQRVAAVITILWEPRSIEEQDEAIVQAAGLLTRIERPGVYTQVLLRRWRRAITPEFRMAVIGAMSRVPEMKELMIETLRDSLIGENQPMKRAARSLLEELKLPNPATQKWMEDQLLTSNDQSRLAAVAFELKTLPASEEFQQQVFERISSQKSLGLNLTLIDYLLAKTDPKTETAKKLNQLKEATRKLHSHEIHQQLTNELREIIWETELARKKTHEAGVESLLQLALPD